MDKSEGFQPTLGGVWGVSKMLDPVDYLRCVGCVSKMLVLVDRCDGAYHDLKCLHATGPEFLDYPGLGSCLHTT